MRRQCAREHLCEVIDKGREGTRIHIMLLQGVPHEVGRVHAVRGCAAHLLGERERSAERRHQLRAERGEAKLERLRRIAVVESAVGKARD